MPQCHRQAHLNLGEPCIERGGQSMYFKGLLAHLHDTTIPSGKKIHVCHACHNAACSNPNHLYWGTASENALDRNEYYGTNIWKNIVAKYGEEGARNINKKNADPVIGGRGNKGKPKNSEHKDKISLAISNLVCYTDGIINIKQHKDIPPPKGFKRGMTRKNKQL